jgi:hypothetical protein
MGMKEVREKGWGSRALKTTLIHELHERVTNEGEIGDFL